MASTLTRIAAIQQAIVRLDNPTGASPTDSSDFASVLDRSSPASGPDDASRTQWAKDLLDSLGAPATSENVRAITAWMEAEGTDAGFNPLATTQSMPGATSFNSVGVKNYLSYADGLDATLRTLTNGRYEPILDALRRGTSAVDVARAVAGSPWGTGTGVLRVLGAA